MNKTVTINLAGIIFHIEERAYEQLKQYLDKLKSRFAAMEGSEEIMNDIESRIAEMFGSKISSQKSAILESDVEEVIAAMGNPEEIADDPGPDETKSNTNHTEEMSGSARKRLYRNPDEKILGGVCGGIGAYFDVDPLWFRLAFIVCFFFLGFGFLLYIIMWIVIPAARTASEKLEMRGERINVDNIEKNVKEEMEAFKSRMKDYGKKMSAYGKRRSGDFKNQAYTGGERLAFFLKDVFNSVAKFIRRAFGLFISAFSLLMLVILTMVVFSMLGALPFWVSPAVPLMMISKSQLTWGIISLILLIGIPMVALFLNGLKLLFRLNMNLKKTGAILVGFWVIGIVIGIFTGISIGKEYSKVQSIKTKENLFSMSGNTISLEILKNEKLDFDNQFGPLFKSRESEKIFDRLVSLDIDRSDNDSVYLLIKRISNGSNTEVAYSLANAIQYEYVMKDSTTLRFASSIIMNENNMFRGQRVSLNLLIPEGKRVILKPGMEKLNWDFYNLDDLFNDCMIGHEFEMTTKGLKCMDCTDEDLRNECNDDHFLYHNNKRIKAKQEP